MSDDKDDLNGFDGLGKTNDDGMHFSEEELEAAMAGFEKEFQDEEAAQQNDAPAQVPFDQPDETVNSDASSDESQDGLQSKEADAVLSEAENSLSFDDELQGLLGNRAKVAVIITRLASARLFAAFCQLSDISAQCLASPQGAVAVLRNLDGDGPEAAIKDLTTVVSGMPAVLAINRADKLEATIPARQRSARRSRHRCCSPPPRRSSKTCCWASPTFRGCVIPAWKPSIPQA